MPSEMKTKESISSSGFLFPKQVSVSCCKSNTMCYADVNFTRPPRWDSVKAGMVVQLLHVAGHFTPGNWGRRNLQSRTSEKDGCSPIVLEIQAAL